MIAHPDDETIGASACMAAISELVVIQVTDGAPRNMQDAAANGFSSRQDYACARHRELRSALKAGQIEPLKVIALSYADQEAALHLGRITLDLAYLFQRLRVQLVLTHPYEGGHPDHDAVAFAAQSAVHSLPLELQPQRTEFTSYHGRDGDIVTGRFLPALGCAETVFPLDSRQRATKEQMLACYRTQQAVLAQFGTVEERFRPAPVYDFARPPHEGPLFYEAFPWGMDPGKWLALTGAALEDLGLW